jgi:hypothetical protein
VEVAARARAREPRVAARGRRDGRVPVKVRWPPHPLGLGTPFNLALLSPETRTRLVSSLWWAPVLGLITALAMMAADQALFGGVTMSQTPLLSEHPPVGNRVLVAVLGSLFEEVVFRAGFATVVGWLVYRILQRIVASPIQQAQWAGTIAAAVAVGLMHVNQVDDPTRFWRIMTLNVIGHLGYGWLYWRRGFELAWLTHGIVTCILYIGVPALRS